MQSENKSLATLGKAIQRLRAIDPEMPMQTALLFLLVAQRPGLTMKELQRAMVTSQASISRNVATLSRWARFDKRGHDLLIAKEDPRERRRKVVFLTQRGELLARELAQIAAD